MTILCIKSNNCLNVFIKHYEQYNMDIKIYVKCDIMSIETQFFFVCYDFV